MHWRADLTNNRPVLYDKTALQAATKADDEQAVALQKRVQAEVQHLPTSDLHQLHTRVNDILCQAARQAFPAKRAEDSRVSANVAYRASARHVWRLYAAMKQPRIATAGRILQQWRNATLFMQASRALKEQSRLLKQAAFQAKLQAAEEAATAGDQRTLHSIVRSLTPSHRKLFSRLRNSEGQLLSKAEEARALADQGRATYALFPDLPIAGPLTQELLVTDGEITDQFRAVKADKAVPSHIAPAGMWKLCSACLGPLFGEAFRYHFRAGNSGSLHGDLTDATMAMLPKPNKPAHILANLRPIGLMAPTSKALAGVLKNRMMEWQLPILRCRPQFAYTPNRGTLDALFRIHKHVKDAIALFRYSRVTRFGLYRGQKPKAFTGALSLSLDLSRAFDLTDRPRLFRTLREYQVPEAVIDVAHRLHSVSRFHYQAGNFRSSFVPSNGLKQGCKVAPCLWVWYTLALMDSLDRQLPEGWVENILTLFADDCWASWLLHSLDDLKRALHELTVLLSTLEDFKMQINYSKTAILLKFVGKQAKQALYDITRLRNGEPHLCLQIAGVERLIPIKLEHDYLGTKVSYHNHQESNLAHRIQCGQHKYHAIQRTLTGKHLVTADHRIRLWDACVNTSFLYSLPAVGLTAPGLKKLETRNLKHLRAILRLPAHLTRTPNAEIWNRAQIAEPGPRILQALSSFRGKLEDRARQAPDITTQPDLLAHVRSEERQLDLLLQARASRESLSAPHASSESWPCPHCDHVASTQHALRIHCGLHHPVEPKPVAGRATAFDPAQHSVGGLPHCRLCGRQFRKWQNLRHHIEGGTCSNLGGASFVLHPRAEVVMPTPPTEQETPPDAATALPQNTPLVMRPFFLKAWQQWDSLLAHPALRHELMRHCVLCQMFIADTKHIKQHLRRMHPEIVTNLWDTVIQRCKPFKSQLVTNSSCPWCLCKVWSPGRHVEQCPVLFQLCLAAAHCEQQQQQSLSSAGVSTIPAAKNDRIEPEPRSGDLQALFTNGGSAEPAEPAGREVGEARAGQQKASPGAAATPRTASTIRSFFPARPRTSKRAASADGQDDHAAGGGHRGASHGQGLHALLSRGRGQHPAGALPSGQGVEQAAGGGHKPDDLAGSHTAPRLPHSTASGPRGLHDSGCRGCDQAAGGGLDEYGQAVDETALVPPSQEVGPTPGGGGDGPSGPHGEHRLSAREPAGGCDPKISLHQAAPSTGGGPSYHGAVLPLGELARGPRHQGSRDVREVDRSLCPTVGGAVNETGHPQAVTDGTTGGTPGIWEVGCEAGTGRSPSSLPPFSLYNDGNACYINSVVYALWAAAASTQTWHHLNPALRRIQGAGVSARRALGFFMMGWPRPWQQHDVAEFYDFIVPRVVRSTGEVWQGRVMDEDGTRIHITQANPLNQCITLPLPPTPAADVQELITCWHQQDDLCALAATPQWLCLQLPRFHATTGAKTQQPYLVPGMLRMPCFADATSQAVAWHSFRVCSIIRHHGPTFHAGHYTVLVRESSSSDFVLDDAEAPKKATAPDYEDTSCSMYVLILCQPSPAPCPSRDHSNVAAADLDHGVAGTVWSSNTYRHRETTLRPALSSGDMHATAGERPGCAAGAHGQAGAADEVHHASPSGRHHQSGTQQAHSEAASGA